MLEVKVSEVKTPGQHRPPSSAGGDESSSANNVEERGEGGRSPSPEREEEEGEGDEEKQTTQGKSLVSQGYRLKEVWCSSDYTAVLICK